MRNQRFSKKVNLVLLSGLGTEFSKNFYITRLPVSYTIASTGLILEKKSYIVLSIPKVEKRSNVDSEISR